MSAQNPYEKFLDGRDPAEIMAATPALLASHLTRLAGKLTERPAPGKWSAAEIMCHLADCELVFAFRLRQTLAEDSPVIQPFDQDKWAAPYPGIPAELAMEMFRAARAWNLQLIRTAVPAAADRPVTHPERGQMTFTTLVETIAGHDLNHLGQLQGRS